MIMGKGFRDIAKEEAEEKLRSFVPSKDRSFIDDLETLFGCSDVCIRDNCKKLGLFSLYERACEQYSTRNIYKAVSDLDKELPTDDNGRIDPARVKQLEARLKGHLLIAERVARGTWGANITTDTTVRVAPSENIDAVIERMGGVKAAREILGGAIGNSR